MTAIRRVLVTMATVAFFVSMATSCKTKQTHCAAYSSIAKPDHKVN